VEDRRIRVRIKYRFLTPEQFQGLEDPPDGKELPVVEGPDPIAFAFEIPPNEFTDAAPILQYRITAQRLVYENGQLNVIASTTMPSLTSFNTEPYITVNAQSNAAATLDAQGGRLSLPDGNPIDTESSIDVPAGVFAGPTVVTLDEIPVGSPLLPSIHGGGIRYYQAGADQPLNGLAQISLLYPDFEFPGGADGIVDGTNVPVNSLGIFVWDGFSWRRLGGAIDTRTGTIRAKIPMFGFFTIAPAPPLTPAGRRPEEKIITPNGDGINDLAIFAVDSLTENYRIEIFDIKGHRIKTIMAGSSLSWDGRDDSGGLVESGIYIYQYEVEGTRTSGFIAVAK
jgi:gliding motility-associated-like protein